MGITRGVQKASLQPASDANYNANGLKANKANASNGKSGIGGKKVKTTKVVS